MPCSTMNGFSREERKPSNVSWRIGPGVEARGVPGLDPVAKKPSMVEFIDTNATVKAGQSLSPMFGYGGSLGGGIMEVGDVSILGWFPSECNNDE